MRLALRLCGFFVCWLGIVTMPDGPWYRELGAIFLLIWSTNIHELADKTPRAGTVHELSKAR